MVHNSQERTDAFEFVIYPVVGHDGSVTSVNFSHDNNWLLTSSCDRTVRLWSHSQSDPLLTLSYVNHNFATELGSSSKLKVSGLIYFEIPCLPQGATNCNQVYEGVTRSHAKTSHEKKRSFTVRLFSCVSPTNYNEVSWRVTRSHAKTSHEKKRRFTARLFSCGSVCSPELGSLIAS